jgi:N-acetyl-anhydromuramyl-L-alanine amidase AmpD
MGNLAAHYPLPDESYTRRRSTDTLVIHCADTTPDMDVGAKEIRQWHVVENGWTDIGYHMVIRRDGKIEAGRPIWSLGAHVEGHNSTSIGISMVGGAKSVRGKNVEDNNFTTEQWATLLRVVRTLMIVFPITKVCGHRDFPGVTKYCPSFDVAAWMKQNKKQLSEEV